MRTRAWLPVCRVCIVLALFIGVALLAGCSTSDLGSGDDSDLGSGAEPPKGLAGSKPGEEWDANGLKVKFCWCPPGKFTMRWCNPNSKDARPPISLADARIECFWFSRPLGDRLDVVSWHLPLTTH